MNQTTMLTLPRSAWQRARLAALAAGPFLTLGLLQAVTRSTHPGEWPVIVLVTALAWSPLFFSIPALLLQNERDAFAPEATGPVSSLVRAVRLIPHLALSVASPVRLEMAVSILAWGVFVRMNAGAVAAGLDLIL